MFEADAQLPHACEPGMGAFEDPAMTAQAVVALDPVACNPRTDAALFEEGATPLDVVGLVGMQLAGPASRTAWFSADVRQGVDQLLKHHRVVPIGAGDADRQGDAVAVDDQMPVAAEFSAIGRVRAGVGAPPGEATLAASRLARLRSSRSARRRSASNT